MDDPSRAHEDAQPEIHELAIQMKASMDASTPVLLQLGEWHLPYVRPGVEIEEALKSSTARCARTSYLNHDSTAPTAAQDAELHDRLMLADPPHASPAEHPAQARPGRFANLSGFCSYRTLRGL